MAPGFVAQGNLMVGTVGVTTVGTAAPLVPWVKVEASAPAPWPRASALPSAKDRGPCRGQTQGREGNLTHACR